MKILHTADWHLGIELANQSRRHEFEKVFDWMIELVKDQGIEALLVAGDIYDRSAPSNEADKLYYDFLMRLCRAGVRKIIIIAGNHDSAAGLNAPREVLKHLSIEVFSYLGKKEGYEDNITLLLNADGTPAASVCAIPYLAVPPKCADAAEKSSHEAHEDALCSCYHTVYNKARELHPDLPVIGMGHLYTPPEPFREYLEMVGTVPGVNGNRMPPFDYFALGHMHKGYAVCGNPRCRYSGSLFTTKFHELGQDSAVIVVDTEKNFEPEVIPIPVFQRMMKIEGNQAEITAQIEGLKQENESIWLKICNSGDFWVNMQSEILELVRDSQLAPLIVENSMANPEMGRDMYGSSTLADIRPEQIFEQMLEKLTVSDEIKNDLRRDLRRLLDDCRREAEVAVEEKQEEEE